jgi:hypothetical protein
VDRECASASCEPRPDAFLHFDRLAKSLTRVRVIGSVLINSMWTDISCVREAKVKVRVRIEVVYTLGLFSDKREWEMKAVRGAAVRKVSIEPQAAKK